MARLKECYIGWGEKANEEKGSGTSKVVKSRPWGGEVSWRE